MQQRKTLPAAFLFASFLLVFLFYPVPTPAKGRGKLHRLKEAFLFNLFLLMIFSTGLYLAHISTNASRLLYYYFFCVNFVLTYLCLEFLHRAEQDYIASHKENTVVFANTDILHPFVFPVKKTGPMKNTFIYEYHKFPSGPVKLPSPLSV